MAKAGTGTRYNLDIRLLPDTTSTEVSRLKRALKMLLRAYGIRCEKIFELAPDPLGADGLVQANQVYLPVGSVPYEGKEF